MPKSKKKSVETEIRNYLRFKKNDKDKTIKEKQKTNVKSKQKMLENEEIIENEDLILRRREKNKLQMQRLRASTNYRKEENARNKVYRQKKRESEEYVSKMREQQKIYMRKMRSDEDYRKFERHRDKLYKRRKRKDLDYLEQIRAKDREYRRKLRAKLKKMKADSDDISIKEESELDQVNNIKIERSARITRSRVKSPKNPPSKSGFREADFELFVLQTRSRIKPVIPKNPPSESGFREIDFDMFVLENMEFIKEPNDFSDDEK